MHHPQCHGPFRPFSMLPDSPVVSSSPSISSCCSSDARLETAFSPVISSELKPDHSQNSLSQEQQQQKQQPGSSRRLKRRASQGSLHAKPSSVSRFLSRNTAAANSRTQSLDSRLHLSTTSSSSSPSASPSRSALSVWQSEYPAALPPTPPEDNDDHVPWNPTSGMLLVEPQLDRGQGPLMDQSPTVESASRPVLTADSLSSPSDHLSSAATSPPSAGGDLDFDPNTWLENGIDAASEFFFTPSLDSRLTRIVSALPFSDPRGEAVKLVSQTLPYPRASDKSVTLPTNDSVFSAMVQAVQNRLQQGQSPYINITHAVPEQFSLSNLPSSPPSTPMYPGDEYFNSTVFSNAAVVSTYHDFRGPIMQMQSLHMPMPVVPPNTVQLSVLERYLPPSSVQEYKDLFSASSPSYLVDRMTELSPDGGSLLFIYPTKRGASTFKSQYLGPILDPLLRQLVVVNELSADVSRYLGKLASVSQMDDFEAMKANLSQLCESLSFQSSGFSVMDARKGSVNLDRGLWTEWFIHQEKARMKEVLNLYWQNGRRLPVNKTSTSSSAMRSNFVLGDKEVTSAMLLGDILDGIRRRPYGEENLPQDGVELGVFVIRRSR